jgi:phytoene dehydrogenase-like protein
MSNARYDTIIIGAGMSGLAAGIRLAQYDQRVLILEKHYLWGGLNSFYKRAGRRFDVGLHALTNYVPKGTKGAPLSKLLRQLRLRHDDLELAPQSYSEIAFPGTKLRFSNDFELFRSEVHERFPHQVEAFERLVAELDAYDMFSPPDTEISAREVLRSYITEPLLVEMLLCPLCYYGSAREGDVDWYQFAILFKSLFNEGFARPEGGIKPLLDLLIKRFAELGGELRMRTGVDAIVHEDGNCKGVRLADGTELEASCVLSSAGWAETMRMTGDDLYDTHVDEEEIGKLSFIETIFVTDKTPAELGHDTTIVFFNDSAEFDYHRPKTLIDPRSGVICCPNNYQAKTPLKEGLYRVTTLANYDRWKELSPEAYTQAKQDSVESAMKTAVPFSFDPRPHEIERDCFTPLTVERFTGKLAGAVYGSSRKRLDGRTPLENLHIIGTDQGLLGVTGSMLSGISIANRYALVPN